MRKFLNKFEIGYGVEILTYLEEEDGKQYFQWDTHIDNNFSDFNEKKIS